MSTVFNHIDTVTTQFGNPSDSSGYRVVDAELIARRPAMVGEVFLVREGKVYGLATWHSEKELYYCTNAMELGAFFGTRKFTAEDLARHFGFPVSLFV